MGNCLAQQEKLLIKVMKTDGEILEYKAPLKVHQLYPKHAGHAIYETLPVTRHLRPDDDMLSGHLYYLLPEFDKKMPHHSNEKDAGVVRIKLVISKQGLAEMMLSKGVVSVEDMISLLQKKQSANSVDKLDSQGNRNCKGWKPVLQSIPEVNY